ncbi:MAG TPA: phenylacetic acid degradation operon negative regulatory protein PaaX [Myxococcota bacterium]|jgi:phenylacetic acid degradation operon negative regulatory protein|nr:phenylacetic acid degradation operon negative regulatory protein PaaX [Myxococcota bacterium]
MGSATPARPDPLAAFVRRAVAARPLRARSLLVTVFGDAIVPHGGAIWLTSLARLVQPLGLSERLTRTAVQRLGRDDWFDVKPLGRRSEYRLTEIGRQRIDDGERRIYATEAPTWDGRFHLVVLGPGTLPLEKRERARRALGWHGFGELSPNVLLHPAPPAVELRHALQELGLVDRALVMTASRPEALVASGERAARSLHDLVQRCWDLRELARAYRGFVQRFRALERVLDGVTAPSPDACFLARTLLVDEYRRVLLRDPELPGELLPAEWPGAAARALAASLYRRLEAPARRFLLARIECARGAPAGTADFYFARFGGLPRRTTRSEVA